MHDPGEDDRIGHGGTVILVAVVAMLAVFFTCIAVALLFPC